MSAKAGAIVLLWPEKSTLGSVLEERLRGSGFDVARVTESKAVPDAVRRTGAAAVVAPPGWDPLGRQHRRIRRDPATRSVPVLVAGDGPPPPFDPPFPGFSEGADTYLDARFQGLPRIAEAVREGIEAGVRPPPKRVLIGIRIQAAGVLLGVLGFPLLFGPMFASLFLRSEFAKAHELWPTGVGMILVPIGGVLGNAGARIARGARTWLGLSGVFWALLLGAALLVWFAA